MFSGIDPVSLQLGEVIFGKDHALCMPLPRLSMEAKMSKLPWLEPGSSGQACGLLCCCVSRGEVLDCPVWLGAVGGRGLELGDGGWGLMV